MSDGDALCPKCKIALPTVSNQFVNGLRVLHFRWPFGMEEGLKSKNKRSGCVEWEKKNRASACGCGGQEWCECGYHSDFCFSSNETCPFCGRILKKEYYKSLVSLGEQIGLDFKSK